MPSPLPLLGRDLWPPCVPRPPDDADGDTPAALADGSVNAEEHETRVIEMGIREHKDRSTLAALPNFVMVLAIFQDSSTTSFVFGFLSTRGTLVHLYVSVEPASSIFFKLCSACFTEISKAFRDRGHNLLAPDQLDVSHHNTDSSRSTTNRSEQGEEEIT